ncbi:SGNH/GDSL hydrolase family protein [Kitasatospora sp. NPDC051853]|uniref:SGNH/GDSL hydrolase family protein n=1 Tax=Kitasatospora sp. NPDC051853 TaxID=3364058 RepID=UPI00378EE15D
MRHRWPGLLLAPVLLAGCTAAGGGTPSAEGTAAALPPAPVGRYVALGDSYTSGLGVPPQGGDPAGCFRSGVNYPALVAKELGAAEFADVSCSSARTPDLTAPQKVKGGVNPAQFDALSPGTELVTLGIGANDAGFMDVLTRCGVASFTGRGCRAEFTAKGGADEVSGRIAAAGQKFGTALAELKRRAPQARVLVVGYPELFPPDPAACAATLPGVAAADVAYLTEKQRELAAELRRRTEAGGASYVPTSVAGRDMCAGPAARWVEPLDPAGDLSPLHPNAAGERGMADAVLAAVR